VTVGTVYRYFRDKDALLANIVDELAVPLVAVGRYQTVAALAEAVWSASRTEPHCFLLRLMIAESRNVPTLLARYRTRAIEPVERELAQLISGSEQAGDPLLAARALLGGLLGASLLADQREPLVPQLSPTTDTIPLLLGSFRPLPPPRHPAAPEPARTTGPLPPDAW